MESCVLRLFVSAFIKKPRALVIEISVSPGICTLARSGAALGRVQAQPALDEDEIPAEDE